MNRAELGSQTAKGGFANEKAVCKKFNNWKTDKEAKSWLRIMGYNPEKINEVTTIVIPAQIKESDLQKYNIENEDYGILAKFKKADIQVRVLIKIGEIYKIENLSLKKANKDADFNHVDRRWVDTYKLMWNFSDEIATWLKLFTGEINPKSRKNLIKSVRKLKDKRRVFIDEMEPTIQNKIITFFNENKIIVISDILKGRGGLSCNWMLVTMYDAKTNTTRWTLKEINTVMNFYGKGDVKPSPQGSLLIGKIFMQRKGGTGNPNQLQFKFKPLQLFELDN